MSRNHFIALSAALLFSLPLVNLQAQVAEPEEKWYQADIIVFRYLSDSSGEAWPDVTATNKPEGTITLKGEIPFYAPSFDIGSSSLTTFPDNAFISLPASEMKLTREANKLAKSGRYEVITQKAWRGPLMSGQQMPPVEISTMIDGIDPMLLDGTITISEERFLHVDADFWLKKLEPVDTFITSSLGRVGDQNPNSQEQAPGEQVIFQNANLPPLRVTANYPLEQRRRIRSTREIQYMDSPVIGVIFKLTPWQPEETDAEESSITTVN
ncbi:CsiV family protein [uncultured Endozoicomonas sp.]|uniref:CsiV family protein n=1 Tax=uncultured Endozoicomonas sp. TaxID=432652 RepID=UPI0026233E4B|nr:CsiV family protein [uncultured Endozoicomonas sp.]